MKRRRDPNADTPISDGATPLTDGQRTALIKRVKDYLEPTRLPREENFKRERELVLQAINERSRVASAAG